MKKMRLLYIAILGIFLAGSATAQVHNDEHHGDTAEYPYWVEMMGDPSVNYYQTVRAFERYWENREVEKGSGYKPFKRWQFGTEMVIDEFGNIPAPGTLEGRIEEYIRMNAPGYGGSSFPGSPNMGPAECLTNGKWISIGPNSLASNRTSQPNGLGRLNAIAFHPLDSAIIYVGSPAGGLWSTQDGGKTWTSNTDTLPTLGVSSIVIDPDHPDTLYIGSGDRDAGDSYGRGVIRSYDGGKTWELANTGMGNLTVGRMAIDPNDPAVIIAATNGGLYRTSDHGNSWSRMVTGNFKEVVFHPANSNIIYAASYASARYYRSTDNGKNWTNITSGLPTTARRMVIGVSPADTSVVYVLATTTRAYEGIYFSGDNGATFTMMSNQPNIMDWSTNGSGTSGQAWYDLDVAIDPQNAGIVYVGGINIFKSADSGKSWKISAHWVGSGSIPGIHADQHVLEFAPNGHLYVGNDGGIYTTANGGTSYQDLSKGLGIAQIYRLDQSNLNSGMIINGYQDNGTGLLENGFWHTILGGDGMDCAIDPDDDAWAYSALYYGDVRRYKNGYYSGRIAANGTNGINESGGWVTPFILKEGSASTMFIGYKNVWRSTNIKDPSTSKVSWTKISSGLAGINNQNINHLENTAADPEVLYVVRSDRKLFKTENAGDSLPTWKDLTSNLPSTAAIRWLESHPRIKDRIWISQSNNKIYRSDDGGNSWTDISNGLPNIPITCILFDSSSLRGGMYAGTYMGVFYTDTAMGKWVWFNTGMPVTSRVTDLDIYYDSSGRSKSHIVASSYGRGNWRSPLFDETQKPPVAEFSADIENGCTDQLIRLTDLSLNTPTRWHWHITPSSVRFTDDTDSFSQHPQVAFTKPGVYAVQLKVENCNGIDSLLRTEFIEIFDGVRSPACSPVTRSTTTNYGIGIFNVVIGTLDHQSTGTYEEGGFVDRTCKVVTELQTDTTYDIRVTTGRNYSEFVKVYIDFNNDGAFSPASELVWSDKKILGLHTGKVTIPKNAVTTALVRMRVVSDYDSLTNNSCDTLHYGQAEDFGVRLFSKKPVPHFTIDKNIICTRDDIVLTDSSVGDVRSHQWIITGSGSSDTLYGSGPHTYKAQSQGMYRVQLILNAGESEKSIDSVFYAKPRPDMHIALTEGDDSLCSGSDLAIGSTDSTGLSGTTNKWFQDGLQLSKADESELAFYPANKSHTGAYYVVTDKDGCTDTSNILDLVVHGLPVVDFDLAADEVCLTYNQFRFKDKTIPDDSSGVQLNWDFGDGSSANSGNPVKSYADYGDYTVTLTGISGFGCLDSMKRRLTVLESPVTGFRIDQMDLCLASNEIRFTDTTRFNGSYTRNWAFTDGFSSTNGSISHSFASDGIYLIRLFATGDNGCSDTLEEELIIYPQPKANFSINDNQQCLDDNSFNFLNTSTVKTGSITEYLWSAGDGTTFRDKDLGNRSYTLTGEIPVGLRVWSNAGCSDSITRLIKIGPNPVADFDVQINNLCFNQHEIRVSDRSTIDEGELSNWYWHLGDGRIETGEQIPSFRYSNSGAYMLTLVVRSALDCTDSLSIPIEVIASPELDFEADIVCEGLETPFRNKSEISSGFITQYTWQFGDGNTSVDVSPIHRYTTTGVYNVTLIGSSGSGCADTLVRPNAVYVLERPEAAFTHQKLSSWESNTEVRFMDMSSSDVTVWDWFIESFGREQVQNPTVVFFDTGHYNVRLVVENQQGCLDTAVDNVFIIPETNVHIPNTFSPNGDNLNDEFGVIGSLYPEHFRMEIYSRWGARLFESESVEHRWDGTFQGTTVEAGMYLYTIKFTDLSGEYFEYEGTVNVLR